MSANLDRMLAFTADLVIGKQATERNLDRMEDTTRDLLARLLPEGLTVHAFLITAGAQANGTVIVSIVGGTPEARAWLETQRQS